MQASQTQDMSDTSKTPPWGQNRRPQTDGEVLEKPASSNASVYNNATHHPNADANPDIVSWNPEGPDHPLNWRPSQVWTNFVLVSILNFISPMGSCEWDPAFEVLSTNDD
jgi:hypothetical protein